MSTPASALATSCPNHPDVSTGLKACARCGKGYCTDCLVELQGKLACAGCKEEVLRDLRSGAAELDLAGPGKRFVGSFVDGLIIGIPTFVLGIFVGLQSVSTPGGTSLGATIALGLISGVVWVIYDGLMTANGGQTVGKRVAGTKVVTPEGRDVEPRQAWIRAGSRVVMALTRILGLVDALFVFSDRKRTLHDRIANTVVIHWRQ
jgi:uncharacterized RDD family membrane protein YckC